MFRRKRRAHFEKRVLRADRLNRSEKRNLSMVSREVEVLEECLPLAEWLPEAWD
jgi:hypothetical protein